MTTIESNILIAEFMGGRIGGSGICHMPDGNKYFVKEMTISTDRVLKYNSSWDWLMPVVEKIEALKLGNVTINGKIIHFDCAVVEISNTFCDIHLYGADSVYKDLVRVRDQKTKFNAVCRAVIEFIQWYNEQNKQS